MLYSFDASTIIHFYDNYPKDNPNLILLWEWFEEKMTNQEFVISKRAFDEVKHKTSPEFFEWFKGITVINDTIADLSEAQMIKNLLEIDEDDFGKGVGENDIFIISIAKRINSILVSEEKRQPNLGRISKSSYKIPAVCKLSNVDIGCINFTDLLRKNP